MACGTLNASLCSSMVREGMEAAVLLVALELTWCLVTSSLSHSYALRPLCRPVWRVSGLINGARTCESGEPLGLTTGEVA